MAKLANGERGQGFTHVERIDLDTYNTTSGSSAQTVTLFAAADSKLRAASIVCPQNLACGAGAITMKLGDSGNSAKFIGTTTISALGADAGTVATMIPYTQAAPADESAYARALSNPAFVIDTNFDIKNGSAFDISYDGLMYTIAADTNFDTGTAEVITTNEWGVACLSIDSDGTTYVEWQDSYAMETLAIIAAKAFLLENAQGEVPVGYVTVQTGVDSTWTAGTDALEGGTGGTVSNDTNYYNYNQLDYILHDEVTDSKSDALNAANGYDITTSLILTLSLSTGNWSSNNGAEFFVLMDIADSNDLV